MHIDLPILTYRIFIKEEYLEVARNPQEVLKTFLTSYLCDLRFSLQTNPL